MCIYRIISLEGRLFANDPGDLDSILGRIIPKTLKIVQYLIPPCLTLSNIRCISKVKGNNPEKGVAPSLHLGVVAIQNEAFWSPSTKGDNFTYLLLCTIFTLAYCAIFWHSSLDIGSHIILFSLLGLLNRLL